jgi:hypothetical protein
LEIESCFLPRLVWTTVLQFYTSHHHWNDRLTPAIGWDGDLANFQPGLASNHDPPNLRLPSS